MADIVDRAGHYGTSVYRLSTGRCVLASDADTGDGVVAVSPVRAVGGDWTRRDCSHAFGPFWFVGSRQDAMAFAETL